jgi:trehalose 6-phosphate phosphatase
MIQPLFEHLPDIASSLAGAEHLLLFFDFDGTLAPIGDDPSAAFMSRQAAAALSVLAGREGISLAIISGRALSDLRERVGLESLIYAGNHGLEISGPEFDFVQPDAAQRIKPLGELARHLRTRLRYIPGVQVENKVLSASVHFRRAAVPSWKEIGEIVRTAVGPLGNLFEVTLGRKVYEIRPLVNWHKGNAVRWIKEAAGMQKALPVYVGDDLTDEDAFTALPEGITVNVGRVVTTSARYYIERQEAVAEFLVWLAESRNGHRPSVVCAESGGAGL